MIEDGTNVYFDGLTFEYGFGEVCVVLEGLVADVNVLAVWSGECEGEFSLGKYFVWFDHAGVVIIGGVVFVVFVVRSDAGWIVGEPGMEELIGE